ncbi:hypothetical protein M3J09_012208 [Ascochyta lentis]
MIAIVINSWIVSCFQCSVQWVSASLHQAPPLSKDWFTKDSDNCENLT